MKDSNIAIICVALAGLIVVGGAAGWVGFRMGQTEPAPEPVVVKESVEELRPAPVVKDEPDPFPLISDSQIENLIGETEEAAETPPGFDAAAMEARRERWESMSMEQRRMMRKSMFSALAKVEGLEELGDAMREGRLDPSQFNIKPEEIADRMEIHAELMDEKAMEAEVTSTLQSIVDQARSQLK